MGDAEPGRNGRDELAAETAPREEDFDLPLTSAADVESAGRSCMAILILGVIIIAVILFWIVARALGVGN